MYIFTIVPRLCVALSCFKQLPLNFTLILVLTESNKELRKLLDGLGVLILSLHNPLDFYSEILSILLF